MRVNHIRHTAAVLCALAGTQWCNAQCTEWSEQFALAGSLAQISDTVIWDDGTGPALYAVGSFPSREIGRIESITQPGGEISAANHVAKWDGRNWNIVGSNLFAQFDPQFSVSRLNAIQVFDPDGAGPLPSVLVVAGQGNGASPTPSNVLQFDGANWSIMGQNLGGAILEEVRDLEVYNGELYACGKFAATSGLAGLAKWDPTFQVWVDVGGGIPTPTNFIRAERMAVGDAEGDGIDELYISGTFTFSVSDGSASKMVKWNGSVFSRVPGFASTSTLPTPNSANTGGPTLLKFMDIGDGPALYVGDAIYTGLASPANTRGVSLARLKNGVWSTLLPQTASGTIRSYTYAADMFAGPDGSQLHIGGTRLLNGVVGAPTGVSLARRTAGGTFEPLGTFPATHPNNTNTVAWMRPLDWDADGPGGEKLLFGATQYRFGTIGTLSGLEPSGMALWNGSAIEISHSGEAPLALTALAFKDLDPDGAGPLPEALYIGHVSSIVAGVRRTSGVLSFDGTSYQDTPPSGPTEVRALEVFAPAAGTPALYAAGTMVSSTDPGLYRLDAASWTLVGASFTEEPNEILPAGFDALTTATVDGEPSLILSGRFSSVFGTPSRFVARYNGTNWIAMDAGLPVPSGDPNLIFRVNVGSQRVVDVAGQLYISTVYANYDNTIFAEQPPVHEIYRWTGSTWQFVSANPGTIASLDLGFGPELYAYGRFQDFGAPGVSYVARWNGTSFEAVGNGISFANPLATASAVSNIGAHDFGNGPELVAVLASEGTSGGNPVAGLIRLNAGQWENVDGGGPITSVSAIYSSSSPTWGGLYLGGGFKTVQGDNLNKGGIESRGIAWLKPIVPCNTCPPCAADYDQNGGVDGGDLAAFFSDFEAGETCADVDNNGGVDGGDLAFFFAVFEAGGC
jgi:hypothetical protein